MDAFESQHLNGNSLHREKLRNPKCTTRRIVYKGAAASAGTPGQYPGCHLATPSYPRWSLLKSKHFPSWLHCRGLVVFKREKNCTILCVQILLNIMSTRLSIF